MKAYEFPVKVESNGTLTLPEALFGLLPTDGVVRIIILVSEPTDVEEQSVWSQLAAEQFLAGYSQEDSIYDRI